MPRNKIRGDMGRAAAASGDVLSRLYLHSSRKVCGPGGGGDVDCSSAPG